MPLLGSLALTVALMLSVYALVAGLWAMRRMVMEKKSSLSDTLIETARYAGIGSFIAVTAAVTILVRAIYADSFLIAYVLQHSNRALPGLYKLAALWAGQEGSLLLWAWLLTGYGVLLQRQRMKDVRLVSSASTVLVGIQVFFLLVLNFAAQPFTFVPGRPPQDGLGLNPLLQYPEMVIHPPVLYLGYVGFSVPFALALGASILRSPGDDWIRLARQWAITSWLFLTCGIFLGAHWAYAVLGWGGYWGWDPVENASLMPWLTGTAFLHASIMQEKRGMMKSWNIWLIFLTFLLSLLGTLLTRSGLVSSVHAFAQSAIGAWFWVFLFIVVAICITTYALRYDRFHSIGAVQSIASRESGLLFNNLLLLMACLAVLWGTILPVLSEYLQGNKVIMGTPFYNGIVIPLGLLLLLLTGTAPLLAWRATSPRHIRKNFLVPTGAGIAVSVLLLAWGVRPWTRQSEMYAFVAWILSAFVMTATMSEFVRGVLIVRGKTNRGYLTSMYVLVQRNQRRYAGYLVHFGVAVIFIGMAGAAFNQSREQELDLHQSLNIGSYRLECVGSSQNSNLNYDSEYALLDIYRHGRRIGRISPERRFYFVSQQPETIVANHSTLLNDLYVVYAGREPDTQHPIIKVFLNPLISWIWIGAGVIVAGTLLAIAPRTATSILVLMAAPLTQKND